MEKMSEHEVAAGFLSFIVIAQLVIQAILGVALALWFGKFTLFLFFGHLIIMIPFVILFRMAVNKMKGENK